MMMQEAQIKPIAEKIMLKVEEVSAALKGPRFTFVEFQNELEELLRKELAEESRSAPVNPLKIAPSTTEFTDREKAVITELSIKQELRPAKVLKQALATYQLVAMGTHELREINPTLKAADDLPSDEFFDSLRREEALKVASGTPSGPRDRELKCPKHGDLRPCLDCERERQHFKSWNAKDYSRASDVHETAERIIKRVVSNVLSLAHTRHSLGETDGDPIDEKEFIDDGLQVALGEDTGCLDPDDLSPENCEVLYVEQELRNLLASGAPSAPTPLTPHGQCILDRFRIALQSARPAHGGKMSDPLQWMRNVASKVLEEIIMTPNTLEQSEAGSAPSGPRDRAIWIPCPFGCGTDLCVNPSNSGARCSLANHLCLNRVNFLSKFLEAGSAPSEQADRDQWDQYTIKRFEQPPCFICGYNGAGYFQPGNHSCATNYQYSKLASGAPSGPRDPNVTVPMVVDRVDGAKESFGIRRFRIERAGVHTAEYWNLGKWTAFCTVFKDRKLAEAVCELLQMREGAPESHNPEYIAEQIFFHVLLRGGEGNPFRGIASKWFVELASQKLRELREAGSAPSAPEAVKPEILSNESHEHICVDCGGRISFCDGVNCWGKFFVCWKCQAVRVSAPAAPTDDIFSRLIEKQRLWCVQARQDVHHLLAMVLNAGGGRSAEDVGIVNDIEQRYRTKVAAPAASAPTPNTKFLDSEESIGDIDHDGSDEDL